MVVTDFVDTATKVGCWPAVFAASPPEHVKAFGPARMPLLGACSTIVVAVVVAASVSTPGALHDTVADATKIDVGAVVTVMVRVSPLTSASVTPMLNTIEVGTAPATSVLTVGALVHVSVLVVVYPT